MFKHLVPLMPIKSKEQIRHENFLYHYKVLSKLIVKDCSGLRMPRRYLGSKFVLEFDQFIREYLLWLWNMKENAKQSRDKS